MAKIKCKRSVYLTAKAGKLNVDATAVRQGMFVQHPLVFPTPPISEAILMALIITYVLRCGIMLCNGRVCGRLGRVA